MFRSAMRATILMTLFSAGLVGVAWPVEAVAQQPEPEQAFTMRMSSRVDSIQSQIRRLERELDGDGSTEGEPRGNYDTMSGIRQRLKALDEQCRDVERELRGLSMSRSAYEEYQRQQNIDYYVMGLEQQLREIRNWMRQGEEEDNAEPSPQPQPKPGPDTVEDGITDEDWAEEWATGGR